VNWLLVAVAALLIVLNAFFRGGRVRAGPCTALTPRARRGGRAGEERRLALRQLDHINEYISTCQVGNTMASIGIGALARPGSPICSITPSAASSRTGWRS